MDRVRKTADNISKIVPYDPKYLPADAFLSANENPNDVPDDIRAEISAEIDKVQFNRYPDPLANELREMIADANGIDRECVLVGNGGDELLFDTALAWGGPGRIFLNFPPTFSVYAANANLTNTDVLNIERVPENDFAIDEERVLDICASDKAAFDFSILASPNNPTGLISPEGFIDRFLQATDALIMVDEAYYEFSGQSVRCLLSANENLAILRTFSKAFSLAGVRIGYIMASEEVIREYIKVRQPYSVDAVSQAIARVVFAHRDYFLAGTKRMIAERGRMLEAMRRMEGIKAFPSDANWILFRIDDAHRCWEYLYSKGILVRDFSSSRSLEDCLRVSIGTRGQNDAFLEALQAFLCSR